MRRLARDDGAAVPTVKETHLCALRYKIYVNYVYMFVELKDERVFDSGNDCLRLRRSGLETSRERGSSSSRRSSSNNAVGIVDLLCLLRISCWAGGVCVRGNIGRVLWCVCGLQQASRTSKQEVWYSQPATNRKKCHFSSLLAVPIQAQKSLYASS